MSPRIGQSRERSEWTPSNPSWRRRSVCRSLPTVSSRSIDRSMCRISPPGSSGATWRWRTCGTRTARASTSHVPVFPIVSGSRVSGSRGSWTSSAPKSPRSFPCTWGDAFLRGGDHVLATVGSRSPGRPRPRGRPEAVPARDSNGPSRPSSTASHRHALRGRSASRTASHPRRRFGGLRLPAEAVARLGPLWLIFDDLQWAEPR